MEDMRGKNWIELKRMIGEEERESLNGAKQASYMSFTGGGGGCCVLGAWWWDSYW